MSLNTTQVDVQSLSERARERRVFYQVFPVLTYQPPDLPIDWVEVALHAEVDIRKPLDSPEREEAVAVLKDLADFVTYGLPAEFTCDLSRSAWYYSTLLPKARESRHAIRLFRSVSVVLQNIPPYFNSEEPALLAELKTRLRQLSIPRI